jgi:hypothetical protein
LQESDFSSVPKSVLTDLLHSQQLSFVPQADRSSTQRHFLEFKLLRAFIRWAKAETKRQGLPLTPVSYRTILGPELLMPLRGLFLTTQDHKSLKYGSKRFDYGKVSQKNAFVFLFYQGLCRLKEWEI